MADEKKPDVKSDNKPKTKKPKKKNSKIDTPSLIFFGVMVVGLIILTIILFTRPTSTIYTTSYGDDFVISAELYSNGKIDLAVDAKEDRIVQNGTFKEITDDDIENNYTATFENDETNEKTEVQLLIVDKELTITYVDGTEIVLKESK